MFAIQKPLRLRLGVSIVVVAVILGESLGDQLSPSSENQRQAEIALDRLGTDITRDEKGNPTAIDFYPTRCSDEDVAHVRHIPTIREVHLEYCYNISDKAIEHLLKLPNLEVLYLYRNNPDAHNNFTIGVDLTKQPRITDQSIATISRIKSLKELYLWDNEFTDDGILKLRALPNLKKLAFRSSRISNDAEAALRKSLPKTAIND